MRPDRLTKLTVASLCANLGFALYHCVLGLTSLSWWLITLGAYYIILSVMRFATLRIRLKGKHDPSTEHFAKKFAGVMFIVLSVCLVGTVILSQTDERGVRHHEIVMITIALYSFVKITLGILNLIKARKYTSPALQTLRSISFADATVSVFSLQRSMLVTFEGMTENNRSLFNLLTGSAVCLTVFLSGLNLIGGMKIIMAKSKIAKATEQIAEGVVGGYQKIEKGVVDGYKKIEQGVVDGYTKIEDKFVEKYLTHEGETVEEAKERLKKK